jgi:CHAT domain-containing protein
LLERKLALENEALSKVVYEQILNEDGLFEAWELMQMDLRAELAVLSACETGRGRVGSGEGLIGMTWAFFVAGVPTIVASQWQVPSESTTRLMMEFHKSLVHRGAPGQGIPKAAAWRHAALALMKDTRYRMKPYYWAGFVVFGDGAR